MSVRIVIDNISQWIPERKTQILLQRGRKPVMVHPDKVLKDLEKDAISWRHKIVELSLKDDLTKQAFFGKVPKGHLFMYGLRIYAVSGPYSEDEAALVLKKWLKKKKEELDSCRSPNASQQKTFREPIPSNVRHEVWRRDQGRCVSCGSVERLEFDHLIPWSKGGSNTARNLQLLCEVCNRKKGAKLS